MGKKKIILQMAIIALLVTGSVVPFLASTSPVTAKTENPYLVDTFVDDEGNEIDMIIVPGRPPENMVRAVSVPEPRSQMGVSILSHVPAFDWCYGCSATSAAMLFGYYDRNAYINMYAGPTNGGVCPLDNSAWGVMVGECPLSATHMGFDELAVMGHVDDYWDHYLSALDPYYDSGTPWTQHAYADCTADYMGTNQHQNWNSVDGSTWFYFDPTGAPLYDYFLCEFESPPQRDGCHGMRLFAESRGYSVVANFNQYIYGQAPLDPNNGFTFADYMAEIDAGRPVLIQIVGHTMLGYGYDTDGEVVYIHNTWDYLNYTMVWGGVYESMQHYGVTVFRLADPPPPTEVWVDGDFDATTPGWGYDHFALIQDGIDAVSGSTVHVAEGTYIENITLSDGVEVLGVGDDVTIIDGGGSGTVVTADGVGATTVLDGFTITNGSATYGGGMYNENSSPTVSNCTFTGNSSDNGGGGMYNENYSSPTVTGCTFVSNSTKHGGGMENYDHSSPIITGCTFESNSANLGDGSGIFNNLYCSPIVTDCTFDNNTADSDGGGMYNISNSSPTVTDCTFTGNTATSYGGGMGSDSYSSPTVVDCTFNANTAAYGGGIYNCASISSSTLTNCTFSGNSATGRGGGIYNRVSSPTMTNCVFYANTAVEYGGGMYNFNDSSPVVTNCTFSGNTAGSGRGICNLQNSSPATVTNCILWDGGDELYNESSTPVVTYCDVQGDYVGGSNIIDADPLFVAPGTGDYHLQTGSPCIDVGNNAAPSLPDTDFEGDPRILDGDGDLVAVVDMGVDEHLASSNNPPNAPDSPLCEGETNPTDVTDLTPEFGWTFSDPDGGDSQGAYQILVASSSGNLAADNGDMWDSGKVSGSDSEVSYAGADLSERQSYYWKVKNWDNYDAEGDYCGEQQFTTGTFPTGRLRVETSPAVPTTISANGIPRNDWGLDWVKMPPGEYTLSFTDTPGYLVPETIEVTYYPGGGPTTQLLSDPIEILPDTTTEVIVHFVQLGNLWVMTDPMVSTIISLDGTPPANNWGFWVDLLPGDYDLSLSDVVGYATPLEVEVTYPGESPVTQAITDPITVEPGGTTAVVVHFIQLGNLQVSTSPMLPATIFVDGNPMNEWGFWLYLEAGDYTVSFQDMPGYTTPPATMVTVIAGVTTYVTGDYVIE